MLSGFALLIHCVALTATPEAPTLDALCQSHPERVQRLFSALDLERPGLAAVKSAVADKQWPAACQALLDYYQTTEMTKQHQQALPKPGTGRDARGDLILDDQFSACAITAKVPRRPDGGLNWSYNGPDGDREWGWGLNRQPWCGALRGAYFQTGNPIYVKHLDALLRDWVLSNPYSGKKTSEPEWRGLETYIRVTGWTYVFFGLMNVEEFSPAVRILMLSSIPDHAHYLRHFHASRGNWIAMELLGLATVAISWPEFKDAPSWYDYAFGRMMPEVTKQVYPDGVQKELTSHYHRVALYSFDRFLGLADSVKRPVPKEFLNGVEGMYNYLAYTMRPDGHGLLNNDSNRDHTRPEVRRQVERFDRADWLHITTNGAEGTKPEGLPSAVFPWAGHVIMRSGWDLGAQWAFFDIGPFGTGHQHCDKLHLSVVAHGRDILVDGGRYTYKGGPFRSYFVGSESHNVVLIDGHGQAPYEKEAEAPLEGVTAITDTYDYARGTFDAGFRDVNEKVAHTRAVAYLRGEYYVVVDRITAKGGHTVSPLWHFNPDCSVMGEVDTVVSTDEGKGNVRITPVGGLDWKLELVKGQGEPDIQGWWSREYNHKTPNTCAVYSAPMKDATTFAWIIEPGKGTVAPLKEAKLIEASDAGARIRVQRAGTSGETVFVPFQSTEVTRER